MLVRCQLDCEQKRVLRSALRVINTNSVQPHSAPSIKGKSRSASKKININNAAMLGGNLLSGTSLPKKNKKPTCRSSNREESCPFNITVFCSRIDHKWHLRY